MKIIAHRCGTDKYPELTVAAARHSLLHGADYVELDLRRTADGAFVVCHDSSARRLFGVNKKIRDISLTEFLSFRHVADRSFPSHTPEHFLEAGIKKMLYHIKESDSNLTDIVELCENFGVLSDCVFGLQSAKDIRIMKDFCPNAKILAFIPCPEHIDEFAKAGADYIRLWENWLDAENIALVKETGKELWVMAGSFITPGDTNYDYINIWREMGAKAILINEVEKIKKL